MRRGTTAEVRLDQGKARSSSAARPAILGCRSPGHPSRATFVVPAAQSATIAFGRYRNLENVGLDELFSKCELLHISRAIPALFHGAWVDGPSIRANAR
jgi:hypothetical protein